MPIRILQSPDPLSNAALDGDQKPILIESETSRLLTEQMRQYCRRQTTGRSFLIAGHRGAGKTTLVAEAYRKVREESRRGELLRPLFVPLHALSLFPETPSARRGNGAPDWQWSTPSVPAAPGAEEEASAALRQIILSLHRAVAKEFAAAFRQRANWIPMVKPPQPVDLAELAAELELELLEGPGPDRLHEFWWRGGFLPSGVGNPWSATYDQGMRELLALTGTCEAFRRISGTYSQAEKSEQRAASKAEAALGGSGRELVAPLAALLSGGLAGTGLAATGTSGVSATLGGIVAALGAALVFRFSATRSRDRSTSREESFQRDLTVATLDRALPTLIDRLLAARLAPIFVVDELDKVDPARISRVVPYLKKLVAESGFFCFLTDRSYFEETDRADARAAYPVAYTYFSYRLFVSFRAADLHAYLNRILEPPSTTRATPSPQFGVSDADRAAAAAEAVRSDPTADDRADYEILPYILLHRSAMHPFDLQQSLAAWRGKDGYFTLKPGTVRSGSEPRYRFDILIQLAIEMVLDHADLSLRLDREPSFARLAHDALYYPSRLWREGRDLHLADGEDETAFAQYLERRAGVKLGPEEFGFVDREDRRFLYERVRDLAALLAADSAQFQSRFEGWNAERKKAGREVPATVVEALRLPDLKAPLLQSRSKRHFRWCYDAMGRLHDGVMREPSEAKKQRGAASVRIETEVAATAWVAPYDRVPASLEFIQRFAEFLTRVSGGAPPKPRLDFTTLSSQLRILSTAPAWTTIEPSLARLRNANLTSTGIHIMSFSTELVSDMESVLSFANLLARSAKTVALALFCGAYLGRASKAADAGDRLVLALSALSQGFKLAAKNEREVEGTIQDLWLTIARDAQLGLRQDDLNLREATDFDAWTQRVEPRLQEIPEVPFNTSEIKRLQDDAWISWRARAERFGTTSVYGNPSVNDLLGRLANVRPADLLKFDLAEMTLCDWSMALAEALTRTSPGEALYCEPWLAFAALNALGFSVASGGFVEWIATQNIFPALQAKVDTLTPWLEPALLGDFPAAFVVRRAAHSLLEQWKVDKKSPVVVFAADQETSLVSKLQALPFSPKIEIVIFEQPIEATGLDQRILGLFPSSVMRRDMYAERPRSRVSGELVIAPQEAADLFTTSPPLPS